MPMLESIDQIRAKALLRVKTLPETWSNNCCLALWQGLTFPGAEGYMPLDFAVGPYMVKQLLLGRVRLCFGPLDFQTGGPK